MKTTARGSKTWLKTNIDNLYLHKGGGSYYRATVGGKQIWESLETKLRGVAEGRVAKRPKLARKHHK